MNPVKNFKGLLMLSTLCFLLSTLLLGCGYTTGSLLPASIKTIYIKTFTNRIDITAELDETSRYKTYAPYLEVNISKKIIDRFIYDGNLRVVSQENADLMLTGELIDYDRQPLRYDVDDEVEEYRLSLVVRLLLQNLTKKEIMWEETSFIGDTTYFASATTGSVAKREETAALSDAIEDLARRVVERVVEMW